MLEDSLELLNLGVLDLELDGRFIQLLIEASQHTALPMTMLSKFSIIRC